MNDIIEQIHHSKSNKIDPTLDALLVRKRLECGFQSDLNKTKRKYEKTDEIFWGTEKSEMRHSKVQRILCEQQDVNFAFKTSTTDDMNVNLENLEIPEIKKKLLELGVKTRKRTKAALLDELRKQFKK